METNKRQSGKLDRRGFVSLGAFAAGAASIGGLGCGRAMAAKTSGAGVAGRLNVIVILADDLGYGDLGCYGATKVKTPNLDRLAKEGVLFTDAHSPSSVCTPTRYNLLTGRYAWRTWTRTGVLWAYDPLLIEPEQMTVASLFKSAGYATGCVGKWHLGFGSPQTPDWDELRGPNWNGPLKPGPLEVGFDFFFGHPTVNGSTPQVYVENHHVVGLDKSDPIQIVLDERPEYKTKYTDRRRSDNPRLRMEGGKAARYKLEEMAQTETSKAISFIEQNSKRPFFLYFSPPNIHGPHIPHPRFRGTSQCGIRGDFIQELDWVVGEVLGTLDRLKLAEQTLVIFSSDNGGDYFQQFGHQSNGELRGEKTDVWEGGHRVPFLARWPGKIKPATRSGQTISLTDMLATCAAILGRDLPPGAGPDSFNILPALLGQATEKPVRETLVNDSWKELFAIRQGPWKLILGKGGGGRRLESSASDQKDDAPGQLYDLAEDLREQNNLYHKHPEIVSRLTALFEKIKREGRSRP